MVLVTDSRESMSPIRASLPLAVALVGAGCKLFGEGRVLGWGKRSAIQPFRSIPITVRGERPDLSLAPVLGLPQRGR